ncbi:DUF6457 domain-containing protein [Nakamurella endophytica]|uniref:DUF6457 domain-containing protein n=1 Tax=Nakamurella endophytica TaxID=1748367 RepID=A0A917TCY8_9ACTN|nr:DUF6457 domain-containing protein [Nakamurella endophytica]GGM18258.1 hypothetical protein GCM10011594_42930 [Nakamurella endophytica]
MSTLDDWVQDAATALSLPPGQIPAALRDELLDLTRDVAHGVTRVAGPLTTYLVGVAVGRGAAPSTALAAVSDLARARAEQRTDGADAASTAGAAAGIPTVHGGPDRPAETDTAAPEIGGGPLPSGRTAGRAGAVEDGDPR